MKPGEKEETIRRYEERLQKHGATVKALGWMDKERQYMRFVILSEIGNLNDCSILDIGCGTGVPTLEIAKLTNGKILAIDSDKESVNRLKENVKKFKYEDRILVVHDSVLSIKFVEKHFDIIVAEGLFRST